MKKTISKVLALLLSLTLIFQISFIAFADESDPDWEDITLTQEEFDKILALNPQRQSTSMSGEADIQATSLILSYAIGITGNGSNLIISGRTNCNPDVVKCGFKVVTIQQRTSSTSSWTTYKTYEDLYNNNFAYTLSKSITVPTGYQYRVTCTHYAKKNLLSTQKINNTSNTLAIHS